MGSNEKEVILFVDDEESLLDITSEYFSTKGYRVMTARDGYEALEILDRHTIDCCFTDINMPGMDGTELAEQIRQIDNTIPVIVMTGYPSLDNTIKTLKNGVVDFLIKPVNLSQMEFCLRSVLRERRLFVDNVVLKQELEKKKQLEKLNLELSSKIDELQILTKIMDDFTTIRRSLDVFQCLVDRAIDITHADISRFFVINESVQHPFAVAAAFRERVAGREGDWSDDGIRGKQVKGPDLTELIQANWELLAQTGVIFNHQNGQAPLPGGIAGFISVPLAIRDKVFGLLTASTENGIEHFSQKSVDYLSFMVRKAAYAIENLALYENIYENLLATLNALVQAIEAKDVYTKEHSRQVTDYAKTIATEMGCTPEELEMLAVAGPLHDIGKIGVPDRVLLKPDRLTEEEYDIIKTHSATGAEIVGKLGLWERERLIIRHHHERYDGSGYPDGLKGESIPMLARILTVADVYDAMASDRVYRKRMKKDLVLRIIFQGAGTQFDPQVIKAFQAVLERGEIR